MLVRELALSPQDLFQIEAVMASICVRRRLRPDRNSLMKD